MFQRNISTLFLNNCKSIHKPEYEDFVESDRQAREFAKSLV
jgi:hypothetical protein